jgi:hypothetical protein
MKAVQRRSMKAMMKVMMKSIMKKAMTGTQSHAGDERDEIDEEEGDDRDAAAPMRQSKPRRPYRQ